MSTTEAVTGCRRSRASQAAAHLGYLGQAVAVGKFIYGDQMKVDLEDRVLAHLQIVMGNKLRRGEPFYFLWKEDQSAGGGRTAVWMHPGASFVFKFSGGRAPAINRTWLEALMYTANSAGGLHVVPEPPEQAQTPGGPFGG